MDANKQKALDLALGQIEKAFGKEAITTLGSANVKKVDAIPTGALSLDLALGVGGIPRGRVIEIYGPEAGGKTTLSLHVAAQAQKNGGVVAFIDAEHALDPVYASSIGVNVDELLISQPDSGEQALEIAQAHGCTLAVLKERSPSCGRGSIYDGTFSRTLVPGSGVAAQLLEEQGIAVYGESRLDELISQLSAER